MTLFEISVKMFCYNFSRFCLYILCSVFAVSFFFCFAALFTNPSFMEGLAVDGEIRSNIIFPSFLAAFFLVVFVPYSYSVFLSARKQEYGIMFSLGMSRQKAWKCLILEGVALGGIALALSFLAGSILSLFFYGIISQVIGIAALQWEIPYKAYAVTALLYGIAFGITGVILGLQILGGRIRSLLLAPYRAEVKGGGYRWMKKFFPNYADKHLLEFSLLARHRREWAVRYVFSALLAGCVLYLGSFCAVFWSASLRDVKNYCPYDLVYSEMFGKNHVPEDALKDTMSLHGVSIVRNIQLSYARDGAFNYLAVSEVNKKLDCSYQIPEGTFLHVFQHEMEDGGKHDIWEASRVSLKLDAEKELDLRACGADVRVLFNKNFLQADHTLILSDADFDRIKSDSHYFFGTMHLIKFQDWKTSADATAAFQSLLQRVNGFTSEEQWEFKAVSKIESFHTARQSLQFCIFLMSFVQVLLLMAAYLLIHSQIAAEQEENKRTFINLFLIGITDEEAVRLCLFKNRMRFLPPLIAALIFSMPFLYKTGEGAYHLGLFGCLIGICIDIFLIAITIITSVRYSRRELKFLKM